MKSIVVLEIQHPDIRDPGGTGILRRALNQYLESLPPEDLMKANTSVKVLAAEDQSLEEVELIQSVIDKHERDQEGL